MLHIKSLASGSTGNCYLVDDGNSRILLECGIRFKEIQQGLDFGLSKVAGCLISHEHKDHCKALKDITKMGVNCYMSRGTAGALGAEGHRVKALVPKQAFDLAGWRILPFETEHDAAEPLGFLLTNGKHKLLYATDTYYIRYKFKGLTHIMVECNYSLDILHESESHKSLKERIMKSHFSLDNVKDFLRANDLSKVEEIWLLHLSDDNSDEERFKREIQELTGKPVYIA